MNGDVGSDLAGLLMLMVMMGCVGIAVGLFFAPLAIWSHVAGHRREARRREDAMVAHLAAIHEQLVAMRPPATEVETSEPDAEGEQTAAPAPPRRLRPVPPQRVSRLQFEPRRD